MWNTVLVLGFLTWPSPYMHYPKSGRESLRFWKFWSKLIYLKFAASLEPKTMLLYLHEIWTKDLTLEMSNSDSGVVMVIYDFISSFPIFTEV